MSNKSEQTISSVETSFTIVEFLLRNGPASVSEIASGTGIPKSTTYVHLQTLHNAGRVVRDGNQYDLGLEYLRIGTQARRRRDIYQAAKSQIDRLADETGEAAHVGVEENGQRVILYKSEREAAVYDNTPTGEFTNLHWTAIGKAILSSYSETRVREVVDQHGLPKATNNTITDVEALLEELERSRERGYAIESEERREGVVAVGMPILETSSDRVIAAVSISGPRDRIRSDQDGAIRDVLLEDLRNRANITELRYNHY